MTTLSLLLWNICSQNKWMLPLSPCFARIPPK
jgi:hypothetical protein